MTQHTRILPHTSAPSASPCNTLALTLVLTGLLLNPAVRPADAQDTRSRGDARMEPLPRELGRLPDVLSMFLNDDKRAVLGVTLGATGPADTLGVLVESVAPGGPADRAGLKGGARITAVNGTSTRLASADAGDPDLEGVARRRLQRVLAKAKPGDDVELRVTSDGGQPRTIRVKTVSAADLNGTGTGAIASRRNAATGSERRASLGVSIGSSGSPRDTLGLFISSVVGNGPAEKAGIVEGERIAGINAADVRVPKEDADDAGASMARVNRFLRELGKASPGDKITLRVYGNGRYRDVTVTAGNSAELNGSEFRFNFGDGAALSIPRLLDVPGTVNRLPMPSRVPNGVLMRRGGGTVKA